MLPVVGVDSETELITPVNKAPPLVCVSWSVDDDAGLFKANGDGLPPEYEDCSTEAVIADWFKHWTIVGHNLPYDACVFLAAHPELMPVVFDAYEPDDGSEPRIRDTQTTDKLFGIAYGEFRWKRHDDGTNERINYRLADLVYRYFGIRLNKGAKGKKASHENDPWRLHYGKLRNVPLIARASTPPIDVEHPDGIVRPIREWPPEAKSYAVDDAVMPYRIFHAQEERRAQVITESGVDLLVDQHRQNRGALWLQLANCWGMWVRPDKRDQLKRSIEGDLGVCRRMLLDEGLLRAETYKKANPKKGIVAGQLKKYSKDTKAAGCLMVNVCADLGLEVRRTKKAIEALEAGEEYDGGVALDEESCNETGDATLKAYAEYTSLSNVLGKDIKHMMWGEIHGDFDPLVESGRTSCRGFNLQNLRRKGGTRECFWARPGFVYCMIDLDTAELRAVAQICLRMFGFSKLAEVLNASPGYPNGRDPHCWLTASALDMTYDEVKALHDADDPALGEERQNYKKGNFGLWGGMGYRRFGAMLRAEMKRASYEEPDPVRRADLRRRIAEMTDDKAQLIRNMWLATWDEAPLYLKWAAGMTKDGYSATVEQELSGRWRGGLGYSQLLNTKFQGLVADAIKDAGWALCRKMYDRTRGSVLYGSRIGNFEHDAIIAEVPEEIGHECAHEIRRVILDVVGRWMPDVPPKATPVLSRVWSKKAKQVWTGNKSGEGRLIAWEPKEKAA